MNSFRIISNMGQDLTLKNEPWDDFSSATLAEQRASQYQTLLHIGRVWAATLSESSKHGSAYVRDNINPYSNQAFMVQIISDSSSIRYCSGISYQLSIRVLFYSYILLLVILNK